MVAFKRLITTLVNPPKCTNISFFEEPAVYLTDRLTRWLNCRNNANNQHAIPRPERITVLYQGFPKSESTLSMTRKISTPYDCTKHLSQLLRDRSVISLVNGCPHDMHKPLTAECTIDFIHFKDIHNDPTEANLAFWRSCQMLLAATLEVSFKEAFPLRLLSFPQTSLESGSFVVDVCVSPQFSDASTIKYWSPSEEELRTLSKTGQQIANLDLPFEYLSVNSNEAKQVLEDSLRMQLADNETKQSSDVCLYRFGNYVQVYNAGPLMSSSKLIGRFSVTSFKLLGRLSPELSDAGDMVDQFVYRVQGIAIPTAFLTHFTTFDVLRRRARQPNKDLSSFFPTYVNITK